MADRTVLVVDDEDDMLLMAELMCQALGLGVQVAPSVAAAREAIAAGGIDLVITDIRMPDEDGFSVVQAAADAGLPCAVMSAHASPDVWANVRAQGATPLPKPFGVDDLAGVIGEVLGSDD